MNDELKIKNRHIRDFLKENKLDGILLSRIPNFAWVTGGRDNGLKSNTEKGVAALFITRNDKYLITGNNEANRFRELEKVEDLGYKILSFNWWTPEGSNKIIEGLAKGGRIASDIPWKGTEALNHRFYELQSTLVEEEVKRYKKLGKDAGRIIGSVCKCIKKGYSEYKISAMIHNAFIEEGINVVVKLIAADKRVFRYRHPIPSVNKLKKYVIVSICAQKQGLIVSLTRSVHFGKLPQDIAGRYSTVLKAEAALILNSKPGSRLGDVLKKATDIYREDGYGEEWKLHHMGGPTGYETRNYLATPASSKKLLLNQAVAWNPTITGAKAEDTIIILRNGPVVITDTADWPMTSIKSGNKTIKRPSILIK